MDAATLQRVLDNVLAQSEARVQQMLKAATPANNDLANANLTNSIDARIGKFNYDPENGHTFDQWFKRYGKIIEEDGKELPEATKVRLLLGKMADEEYSKYRDSVSPTLPDQIKWAETLTNLKELFAETRSLFVRRYDCFKIRQQPRQDITSLVALINASCENANLSLTKEELKCIILVIALRDENHDLRQKCLKMLEDSRKTGTAITLKKVEEELRTIQLVKESALSLMSPPVATNAIRARPQQWRDSKIKPHLQQHGEQRSHNQQSGSISTEKGKPFRGPPTHPCGSCGLSNHWRADCRLKDAICSKCQRKGHIAKVCRQTTKAPPRKDRSFLSIGVQTHLMAMGTTQPRYWKILITINGVQNRMNVDTGAQATIIPIQTWIKLGKPALSPSDIDAKNCNGEPVPINGKFECVVKTTHSSPKTLTAYVSETIEQDLLGLPWIEQLEIIPTEILFQEVRTKARCNPSKTASQHPTNVNDAQSLIAVLQSDFSEVFSSDLGRCTKAKAHLILKPDAKPVYCKARPVPHGATDAVNDELDRLLKIGAIKPIEFSHWAAPILAVKKKNGKTRVCIDFSTGLNNALELNRHPLPRPENIYAALNGAAYFSNLDLRDAYLQMELDTESQQLCALNTHRGLFQCQRLPFGVKSAPSIFQHLMDQICAGIPGVFAYLDDGRKTTNPRRVDQRVLDNVLAQSEARVQQMLKAATPANNDLANANLTNSIDARIGKFNYDPENGHTFDQWFKRYGKIIEEDGKELPEATKVRLLLGKMADEEYSKYRDSVSPTLPDQIKWAETLTNLKELFAETRSLFVRRYDCFKIRQQPRQDITSLVALINASCENANLSLTKEELKCIILVIALRDENHDLRQKCLKMLEDSRKTGTAITLKKVEEELRTIQLVKESALSLMSPPVATNAIRARPQQWRDSKIKPHLQQHGEQRSHNQQSGSISTEKGKPFRGPPTHPCGSCGLSNHWRADCRLKDAICSKCQRKGHIAKVCRQTTKAPPRKDRSFLSIGVQTHLMAMGTTQPRYWKILITINGVQNRMNVDTGAQATIIPIQTWIKLGKPALSPSDIDAKNCNGEPVPINGKFECVVKTTHSSPKTLTAYVSETIEQDLLGLPWIEQLEIIPTEILFQEVRTKARCNPSKTASQHPTNVNDAQSLIAVLQSDFSEVFSSDLGRCTKAKAHLILKPDAKPVYCKARPVPHGATDAVNDELDRLLKIGAIKPIEFSHWAAPILAVKKKNGKTRVCIDFSTGLNNALELNRHPLPRPENIYAALNGAAYFSNLDLRDAYLQMELDTESQQLCALNTHRGLFQCQRLPFGVKSAPSIFQHLMDQICAGIPGVFAYLDDGRKTTNPRRVEVPPGAVYIVEKPTNPRRVEVPRDERVLDNVLAQSEARVQQMLKAATPANNDLANANLTNSIDARIGKFNYDPENGHTFDQWFKRYGKIIEEDGKELPEATKVRLLLGKMADEEYSKYRDSVSPTLPDQIKWAETLTNLKELFAETRSLFVRRYDCFKIRQQPRQDITSLVALINASCENANLSLTKEELKCIILVEEELRTIQLVKESALSLMSPPVATNAIRARPQQWRDSKIKPHLQQHGEQRSHNQQSGSISTEKGKPFRGPPTHPCGSCGLSNHWRADCRLKDAICSKCQRKGHIAKVCRQTTKAPPRKDRSFLSIGVQTHLMAMGTTQPRYWKILITINGVQNRMNVDTGAQATIIPIQTWIKLGKPALSPSDIDAKNCNGEPVPINGKFECVVKTTHSSPKTLTAYVSETIEQDLLGLPWIEQLEIIPTEILFQEVRTKARCNPSKTASQHPTNVNDAQSLIAVLQSDFSEVFSSDLGRCTKAKAHLILKPDAKPVYCKARPVPHGATDAVNDELDRLLKIGAIKPIEFSHWAAPILAVKKKNGKTRVCIDFSTGLNNALELNRHPLPRPENIYAALNGAAYFSNLDLRDAYLQMELDTESQQLCALNTHRGLFEHASCTLSDAQQNYSQIEKKALALVFAVQKLHRMLFGHKFTLLTDHKPLLAIFGSKKGIPIYSASRLQRWALILTNYDFVIKYVNTAAFGQADVLFRLIANYPRPEEDRLIANICTETECYISTVLQSQTDQLPITAKEIAEVTAEDEILSEILRLSRSGWPKKVNDPEFTPYFPKRDEIIENEGCLMYQQRIIVPSLLRARALKTLHMSHPGIVRMKALARRHFYWPGLDSAIEKVVRECEECQNAQKAPTKAALAPWPPTSQAFQRVHIDFAGPCEDGHMYLILVDSFSKWPEVCLMNTTTSSATIKVLRSVIYRSGVPEEIVSDNGTQFRSAEFAGFCKEFGIKHTFTPPFHPQSNGQVERFVDTFKRAMKKCAKGDKLWAEKMLLSYRTTPSAVLNGHSPEQLFFGRKLRTTLSLIHPRGEQREFVDQKDIRKSQLKYSSQMTKQFDEKHGAKPSEFGPQDPARLWKEFVTRPRIRVLVPSLGKRIVHRHANQLRRRFAFEEDGPTTDREPIPTVHADENHQPPKDQQLPQGSPPLAVRRSRRTIKPRTFYSPPPARKSRH
uniref:RNA-directed DNA polymerase n=1 Tax=Globodera rostochiensis TaxID=31243 RepID=A0A914I8I2_GLORO